MKFIVSSSVLLEHLQAESRVINSKNALPILDCFLFEVQDGTLSVSASDSETSMVTTIEVKECDENGRFAISAKNLLDALKEIPDQPLALEINLETYEVQFHYQNGKFSLVGQNADVYPQVNQIGDNVMELEMDAQMMLNGLNRTAFAAGSDELRPVMSGVFFDIKTDKITLVASDGHILVRNEFFNANGKEDSSFILPRKPVSLLRNLLSKEENKVVVKYDERRIYFLLSDYQLFCRQIEGRYPNYNSVIPQNNPYKVIVDRQQLMGALRRVSVFTSQASGLLKFTVKENELTVSGQDIDFSTSAVESLSCQYTGSPMSIGFRSTYLIDILNSILSNEVQIELADPSRAGLIIPSEHEENEDLLMLLMPMMLND
ncbi:MAG: DNA polymerase III subunit beta [Bacteroidaceae bacterium]|nr:DNA polymerase III subunit beta [Bacteroidaceae bacterium]